MACLSLERLLLYPIPRLNLSQLGKRNMPSRDYSHAEIAGVVVGKSEVDAVSVGSADTGLALDDRGMLVVLEVSHAKETNSVCVSVSVDQTVTLSVAVWVSVSVRVEVVVDTGGS